MPWQEIRHFMFGVLTCPLFGIMEMAAWCLGLRLELHVWTFTAVRQSRRERRNA